MSTSTKTPSEQTQKVTFPKLVPADRSCANSSAQALVRMVKGNTDLLLDAHAYNLHQASLIGAGWEVYEDIREVILNPPKSNFDTTEN